MEKVVLINKLRTITPLQAIVFYKKQFPNLSHEKISYAGRLDPMADGLLLLLIGNENKKRDQYQDLSKTYHFTFLRGITTDTYDLLGRITSFSPSPSVLSSQIVTNILTSFIGTTHQPYPPYSSKTVQGKPLYYWAREGKLATIDIPQRVSTITSLIYLKQEIVTIEKIIPSILHDIAKVQGDFRQSLIMQDWKDVLDKHPLFTLQQITCRATISSGTYIRSLVHKLGQTLGDGAVTLAITRESIGKYSLKDALTLRKF